MIRMFKISGLIIILALIYSCKKSETPPSPDEIIIAKEVKVINNQTWNEQFISLDSANYTITFSKNITSSYQFKAGDIIVSAAGEGLLRKVQNVSESGNEIIVQTVPASLTEIIQQGSVEYDQPLTISQVKSIDYYYTGIKLKTDNSKGAEQSLFDWDINSVLYDNDGNLSTTGDQINLTGTFSCDWRFALKINVGLKAVLKEVKFGFESNENLDLQLLAGMQYSFEKKITLANVNFAPITVFIGTVPIVFTPQLKVSVGVDGSANASLTSEITQSISFKSGVQYLQGKGWSPFNTFNKTLGFQPPQLNMNAGAGAYLKPELLLKIYSVAGPYVNLKLYGRLDADLLQTPWWKLYGGITMNAGAKVDILDKLLLEYTVSDLVKYEEILAQATGKPVSLPTITTTEASLIAPTAANSGGDISDYGGAPVTARGVCWSTSANPTTALATKTSDGTGTGVFISNLTGLTANTTYFVRAYATNSAGTGYGNQVSFTTSAVTLTVPDVPTGVTATSGNGQVTVTFTAPVSNGGSEITGYTVTSNPGNITGTGSASPITVTGLTNGTAYTFTVTATNAIGTSLASSSSNSVIPSTTTTTVSDIEGNIYNTVIIGTQTWMAENLKTTKYNDGTAIPYVTDNTTWYSLLSPGYCWYNNDETTYKVTHGGLYNGYTVYSTNNGGKNVCPTGWHVPTDDDWTILTTYLGGEWMAGGKLKETGTNHWLSPNTAATNETGFTALPGGHRESSFYSTGSAGDWWSSTENSTSGANSRNLYYLQRSVNVNTLSKRWGLSVRCLHDN